MFKTIIRALRAAQDRANAPAAPIAPDTAPAVRGYSANDIHLMAVAASRLPGEQRDVDTIVRDLTAANAQLNAARAKDPSFTAPFDAETVKVDLEVDRTKGWEESAQQGVRGALADPSLGDPTRH